MIDSKQNLLIGYRHDYDPDKKIIKQEKFVIDGKEMFLSTIDLGLNFGKASSPELYYETMAFRGQEIIYHTRYTTRKEAVRGHEQAKKELGWTE